MKKTHTINTTSNNEQQQHIIDRARLAGDVSSMILFANGVALMHAYSDINEQIDAIFNDNQAKKIFIGAMSQFDITSKRDVELNLENSEILSMVIGVFYNEWVILPADIVQISVNDAIKSYNRLRENDLLKEFRKFYGQIFNKDIKFIGLH